MVKKRSRTQTFALNTVYNLLYQTVLIISGFIVPRLMMSTYGSEVNGLIASLNQIINWFLLVEAGLSAASVFMMYEPLKNNDWPKLNSIVSSTRRYYFQVGYMFLGLIVVLAVAYPLVIESASLGSKSIAVLVFAIGGKGIVDFFALGKYRALLTAMQDNWIIQLASSVYVVINTIIIFVLVHLGFQVEFVYAIALTSFLIRSAILILYARAKCPQLDMKHADNSVKIDQRWDAFYLQVLGAIQAGAPVIIATFLLGDLKMVSVLSIYLLVASGIQMLVGFFGTGMQASFGEMLVEGTTERFRKAYFEYEILIYLLNGAICGVAFAMLMPFVSLYTAGIADNNYIYPELGFLSLLSVFLFHLKTPQGLMVMAAGKYRDTRTQTTIQALILLVGGCLLAIPFGSEGIMAAACLSNAYRIVDLIFYSSKHITHTQKRFTIKNIFLGVIVLSGSYAIAHLVNPQILSWTGWIFWTFIFGIVALLLAMLIARVFAPDVANSLLGRLKSIIKK